MEDCWQFDYNLRPSFKEILFTLDEALVDVSVRDHAGRKFWKDNFLFPKKEIQENVAWVEYVQKLQLALVYSQPEKPKFHEDTFKKLKEILTEKTLDDKPIVTMSRFNQVLTWFGIFFEPSPRAWTILDDIRQLVDKEWFHYEISKEEAEKRLNHRKEGFFLVRLSTTTPEFPLTVSLPNAQHRRIKRENNAYSFKDSAHEYSTIIDLIEHNKEESLAKDMTSACPKTPVDLSWGYT